MDVADALSHPLFFNKSLGRRLNQETLNHILSDLEKHGNLEWCDDKKTRFMIYWKSISYWAKSIYTYASNRGLINTVCTFYELTNSDDVQSEEFYCLDETVLRKTLKSLESEGKAVLINFEGSEGVKFL
jgi:ESCRT-II complex subunit VPS25